MADIKTELASNQTLMFVIPSLEYNEKIVEAMKGLSGSICYVTTNKTFDSLKEIFDKNKINIKDVIFVDTISKSLKKTPDQTDNSYFVSSPGALTELSLVINKFLKHDFDYLVFDSLTNLAIYQNSKTSVKFIADLINKIKKTKTKAVLYAVESAESEDIISKVSTFVDKVVKAGASKKEVEK
jgi:archaellum biogenesis ATPase FlaH